ncbi:MAG: glycosyltransferase family 1 protein [Epsilonproteobacteria bacterium]|nr:MAG: glycosyltransferase family 1 protein [Campylobacterota bacterium]
MKLIFDYRVLTHTTYTGVENYTKYIFENIKDKCDINIAKPKTTNKYLAHLWTHFILAFKSGDLLFCPANIAPIFVPNSKKLVVTIHDIAFITQPNSFSNIFRLYYTFVMPFVIRRADKIITVSEYSREEILNYYPYSKGKIEVIYLGLDKSFNVMNIEKKNQILYVGSLNSRKNFIGVLKAFELLNSDNYKLVMVGNFSSNFSLDEENKQILQSAKNNPNIEFKSGISNDELIVLYNQSLLFLFPSFYEGFGLPVLEAMACGTPVICSNKTSLPEVGGDAVVYCDPYNTEDIKEKIELVLGDETLLKELIQKGLNRAKEFSWEESANEHIKIFNEVIR